MIDPQNVTDFNRNELQLQELLIFCIAVFNKNADQTKVKVENFLNWCRNQSPAKDHFARIRVLEQRHFDDGLPLKDDRTHHPGMKYLVHKFKFGNTTQKSNGIHGVVNAGLNLRTCTPKDLEQFNGIGMKTSRYFILHTRKDARVACLDTHVLRWLREKTKLDWIPTKPPSGKKYLRTEKLFLHMADWKGISPAELDLAIWNAQRGSEMKKMAWDDAIKNWAGD